MRKLYVIFATLVLIASLSLHTATTAEQKIKELEREKFFLEIENVILTNENDYIEEKLLLYLEYKGRYRHYKQKADKLSEMFESMFQVEATGYAPLDPLAVEGVCYQGDPTVTASGARSDPDVSIAMDNIPFGTRVLVEGFGERVVHDRGGDIRGKKIDIMFHTQAEALLFGRRQLRIIILD